MTAQRIPIARIDLPEADPLSRTLSKASAAHLADWIRIDGLAQPVVLRPNPYLPST